MTTARTRGGEDQKIRDELVEILPELGLYARSLVFAAEDAEDLVGETCLRCLERQSQFKRGSSLIAWAIRICRNLHIDRSRSGWHGNVSLDLVSEQADPLSFKAIEDRLAVNEVHRMIHRLPTEQREVLVLKGGGFRYDEIAQSLSIPRGTVMSRLYRGRKALEEMMTRKVAV